MNNMERKKFKEILNNSHKFVVYLDADKWVSFKKKEDIKGLTDKEIYDLESYFIMESYELVMEILNELKFVILDIL
jgi:hypothetical protein